MLSQGVGHFLYTMMGDSSVCEHFGQYQSSELSRFRHSKRKYRICPLCGHQNGISVTFCEQTLYLVEYRRPLRARVDDQNYVQENNGEDDLAHYPAQPAGHGAAGPGGHFTGKCLCSATGCAPGVRCAGFPNPFYVRESNGQANNAFLRAQLSSADVALVKGEHIRGWSPGTTYRVHDLVYVSAAPATDGLVDVHADRRGLLWSGGRWGGEATVVAWRRCGGRNIGPFSSWHGPQILNRVPWVTEEEDASVLLLQQDGSTGLDLSFATHIFLLERIHDPALRNQIISRAHRVGATGPVQVQLLQVVSQADIHLQEDRR